KFSPDGQSLIYSTFLGGSSWDWAHNLAVKDGYVYITGYTESSDFPTINAYDSTHNGDKDCFVTKFSPDGQFLNYSTYIGGTSADEAWSIVVDSGYAYITGDTYSSDYPTFSAYDSTHNGFYDCFVTKLSIDGLSLDHSTFLGATWDDLSRSIAVENGYVYVTGYTYSTNFPTSLAYDPSHSGGDTDCFLTKFSTDLLSLVYSTYIGGTSEEEAHALVVEGGYVYITGFTDSDDFPTANEYDSIHNGGQDIFLTIFAPSGISLVYSTFFGGAYDDEANDLAVEGNFVYLTGLTHSADFPIYNAHDWTLDGPYDCFVSKLAIDGRSLISSTFLGGSHYDIGEGIFVDRGYVYIAGFTQSDDFPMVNAYDSTVGYAGDCFMCIMADDSDMDGLTDREEATIGTNPLNIDSDNDNFLDAYEVEYGSDPLDAMSYPVMPQSWYDAIYDDLDGNATLIQQVISWLDGNHTAIETLFFFVEGNATLLLDTVNYLDGNSTQLATVAALVTQNAEVISTLNASIIGDFSEIRAVIDMLGATVGDLDYDGLDDLDEISYGTDVDCIDTDTDNLNDAFEVKIGTDPLDDDSDGDSYLDGIEVIAGTDPLNAQDYPGATTTPPPVSPFLIGVMILGAVGVVVVVVVIFLMKHRRAA
ncbi:MAG: hypothetical protein ACFFBL_09510, partial [Promethearchaeota archaeon]